MSDKGVPPGKQYVYAFSSGKLVLLVSVVLILMALSLMLGIRLERFQSGADLNDFGTAKEPASSPVPAPEAKAPTVIQPEKPVAEPSEKIETPAAALTSETSKEKAAAPPEVPAASAAQAETAEKKEEKTAPAPKEETKVVAVPTVVKNKKAQPPPPPEKGHYAVQVSSSQEKAMAANQVDGLKRNGFSAFIEETVIEKKGRFYRVLVGPYATEAEAVSAQNKLKKDSTFAGSFVRYLP